MPKPLCLPFAAADSISVRISVRFLLIRHAEKQHLNIIFTDKYNGHVVSVWANVTDDTAQLHPIDFAWRW
jgi:hypothetical protein